MQNLDCLVPGKGLLYFWWGFSSAFGVSGHLDAAEGLPGPQSKSRQPRFKGVGSCQQSISSLVN